MKNLALLCFFVGIFFTVPSYSTMYKCKMPDNSYQYSDKPCKKYNKKQESEIPKFNGKRINILFEDEDIRAAFREVAGYGGYSVTFHRVITGTISANYYKTPWDEIIYRMAESENLSAMIVPGQSIKFTPNQMTLSGEKRSRTPAEELKKCKEICTQKYRSCKYLTKSRAYGTTTYECSSDHYQCQKACNPGISIY